MTTEDAERKLKDITERFNNLTTQRREIEEELFRLQGEYRVYEEMLTDKQPESDPSKTVTVKEKEDARPAK